MIDTHCHIYVPQFTDDLSEVLDRAFEAGITDIVMPSIDLTSKAAMAAMHHDRIRFHPMAGIHPCDVKGTIEETALWKWAHEPDVVGIGESGLDYYWSSDYIPEQKDSFRFHCRLARELNKPLVIHNRESTFDMLAILEEEQDGRLRGIWHCFNGSSDEGKTAIDLGFHLGIGGVVTFKNGGVDKTLTDLPLDCLVLETDAPYLAPAPHRGKRNEPAYTQLVGIKLSAIYEKSLAEIDAITTETARNLFNI
ncbi:MAG: TatD family hydrolase [Bacteroidetes bacterium]|nr:TatD family hydrolase [Bacteroidota bacterium]MCH8523082.1 TatD family hydrolase [Balneolales bacterium]